MYDLSVPSRRFRCAANGEPLTECEKVIATLSIDSKTLAPLRRDYCPGCFEKIDKENLVFWQTKGRKKKAHNLEEVYQLFCLHRAQKPKDETLLFALALLLERYKVFYRKEMNGFIRFTHRQNGESFDIVSRSQIEAEQIKEIQKILHGSTS